MPETNPSAIGALLAGMELPAGLDEIVHYAEEQGASENELDALREIDERRYESAADVVEALRPAQPYLPERQPSEPRAESGEPPGGDDYTA